MVLMTSLPKACGIFSMVFIWVFQAFVKILCNDAQVIPSYHGQWKADGCSLYSFTHRLTTSNWCSVCARKHSCLCMQPTLHLSAREYPCALCLHGKKKQKKLRSDFLTNLVLHRTFLSFNFRLDRPVGEVTFFFFQSKLKLNLKNKKNFNWKHT